MKAVLKENVSESMFLITTFDCDDEDLRGLYDIDYLKNNAVHINFFNHNEIYKATMNDRNNNEKYFFYTIEGFNNIFQIVEN